MKKNHKDWSAQEGDYDTSLYEEKEQTRGSLQEIYEVTKYQNNLALFFFCKLWTNKFWRSNSRTKTEKCNGWGNKSNKEELHMRTKSPIKREKDN